MRKVRETPGSKHYTENEENDKLSDGESDVFIEAIGVYLALVNVCIA